MLKRGRWRGGGKKEKFIIVTVGNIRKGVELGLSSVYKRYVEKGGRARVKLLV